MNVMDFGQTAIELIVGFFALFLWTKVLGKTQITQITAFDFISALILGELVGNAIYDKDIHVDEILFATFIWGALIFLVEYVTMKYKGSRRILEGEPSIVIRRGRIQKDVLKKNKVDINQLQHLLRSKDVFSIREVEFAILETDGSVSVLKKGQYATPTIEDMQLTFPAVFMPVTLVIDGEVIWDNLKHIKKDEAWLQGQLSAFGTSDYKEILFAEWQEGDGMHVDKMSS